MTLAVIPARGGSKRIPRKNIRPFAGKPIIAWAIETAQRSGLFERVIVSTDDGEIADIAGSLGAQAPFVRPAGLADDHCGTLEVVAHAVQWAAADGWDGDGACCLYATAAFASVDDLRSAGDLLRQGGWDYVLAAGRFDRAVQRAFARGADGSMELLFENHRLSRSQDLAPIYYDAGQFYWGLTKAWLELRPIFGQRTSFVELPSWRAHDIDTPEDWTAAERQFHDWKARTE
jgi:N-acylneuraminate cytidylyltransferase